MSTLLSIDPGKRELGWAQFEGRELRECGLSIANTADAAKAGVIHRDYLALRRDLAQTIICERMVVRYAAGGAVRVSDVLDVNLIAGIVGRDEWVTATDWKGSVPKAAHQKRIKSKLNERELELLETVCKQYATGIRHNVVDAVGIGLYRLGRL